MSTETDKEALVRILGEVLLPDAPKHDEEEGILSYRFTSGIRLLLQCGPTGRLNGASIQRADDSARSWIGSWTGREEEKSQAPPNPALATAASRAKNIVNAIFSELDKRGGLDPSRRLVGRHEVETYTEMHAACTDRVLAAADGKVVKLDDIWNPEKEEPRR